MCYSLIKPFKKFRMSENQFDFVQEKQKVKTIHFAIS